MPPKPNEKTVDRKCVLCGRPFKARERVLKRGWGIFCSKQHANIARSMGRKNVNYKGGRSYHAERVSAEDRERIRLLDGNRCVQCGVKNRTVMTKKGPKHSLEIHHIRSVREGGTDDDNNLVTLCRKCHRGVDFYGLVLKVPNRIKERNESRCGDAGSAATGDGGGNTTSVSTEADARRSDDHGSAAGGDAGGTGAVDRATQQDGAG